MRELENWPHPEESTHKHKRTVPDKWIDTLPQVRTNTQPWQKDNFLKILAA